MKRFSNPKRINLRGKLSDCFYSRVYDTETKKRIWTSTGRTSLTAALSQIAKWQAQDVSGKYGRAAATDLSLEKALEEWATMKAPHLSAGARRMYAGFAAAMLASVPDRVSMRGLTESSLEGFFRVRAAIVTPTTLNKQRRWLRQFFRWAISRGMRDDDPSRTVQPVTESRREIRALDDEEVAALLRACRETYSLEFVGKRNTGGIEGGKTTKEAVRWSQEITPPAWLHPAVFLALKTGARLGNLNALLWSDLDLRKRTIRFRAEATKTREELSIPIDEETSAFLAELRREAKGVKVLDLPNGRAVLRAFRAAAKRAKVAPIPRFHDLRATFISRARRSRLDVELVAKLVGHRSIQTTLRYYRRIDPKDLRDAIKKLGPLGGSPAAEVRSEEPPAGSA